MPVAIALAVTNGIWKVASISTHSVGIQIRLARRLLRPIPERWAILRSRRPSGRNLGDGASTNGLVPTAYLPKPASVAESASSRIGNHADLKRCLVSRMPAVWVSLIGGRPPAGAAFLFARGTFSFPFSLGKPAALDEKRVGHFSAHTGLEPFISVRYLSLPQERNK